jgi:hypothetical protein
LPKGEFVGFLKLATFCKNKIMTDVGQDGATSWYYNLKPNKVQNQLNSARLLCLSFKRFIVLPKAHNQANFLIVSPMDRY